MLSLVQHACYLYELMPTVIMTTPSIKRMHVHSTWCPSTIQSGTWSQISIQIIKNTTRKLLKVNYHVIASDFTVSPRWVTTSRLFLLKNTHIMSTDWFNPRIYLCIRYNWQITIQIRKLWSANLPQKCTHWNRYSHHFSALWVIAKYAFGVNMLSCLSIFIFSLQRNHNSFFFTT